MFKNPFLSITIPALLGLPVTTAFADSELLSPMLVTASRLDNPSQQAASISIITAEDIKRSAARDLPELLAQLPGVNIRSLFGQPNSASIDIRGFGETSGQNTLILLDGRRLNDVDLSNVNFAAIPMQNIDRIEVIRGSGAVLYGDGASGGVINIISKKPQPGDQLAIIDGTVGTHSHRQGNVFGSLATEQLAVTANINSLKDEGYRDNNRFRQHSGQLDVRVPVLTNDEIYLQLGAYDNETDLPGVRLVDPGLGINQLRTDRRGTDSPDDWAKERGQFATLGYTAMLSKHDTLIIDGGYRKRQQKSQFDYGFGFGDYADTELRTLSFTPRLVMDRQLAGRESQWIVGMDWYDYDYRSDRADFRANSHQPVHKIDVDQRSLAFYAQGSLQLTSATTATAGVRTQRVRLQARDQFDASAPGGAFGSEAAPSNQRHRRNSFELGLRHDLNEQWSVFARTGRSVRFGTVDELFQLDPMFQQEFSELTPQTARNYELGLNYQHQQIAGSISVFQQRLNNEIRFNPENFQNENLDKTRRKGLELAIAAPIVERLSFRAAYTYLSAKFREGEFNGKHIPLVPEHTYNLSLFAQLPADFRAALNWNHVSSSYLTNDLSNNFGTKIPSYQTTDLKLSKQIDKLELSLQINNLFNERYYNFGVNSSFTPDRYNAYPLPRRTTYLTVSYQFD